MGSNPEYYAQCYLLTTLDMGCDIHPFVEVQTNGKWKRIESGHFSILDTWSRSYEKKTYGTEMLSSPFNYRDYGLFGFLADVRNYSHSEVLSEHKGLPVDSEHLNEEIKDSWGFTTRKKELEEDGDYHSRTYLTLKELLDFDYDKKFWDKRCVRNNDGAAKARIHPSVPYLGEGEITTYRKFLGRQFFHHLAELQELGRPEDVRVVFYFDN